MMVHACNPSIHEAEAGELGVRGQPGLPSQVSLELVRPWMGRWID